MATAETLRLGPADHGRVLTLDEFRAAEEEEGYRFELARGVVEVSDIPDDAHGQIVSNLYVAIAHHEHSHPGVVRRFGGASNFPFWLPGLVSARNPDVGVVLRGAPRDARGRRVASLAVEVVSEGSRTRDHVTKREEYLAYGLREYWIVDPEMQTVTVLVRDGDAWREQVVRGDQPIPSLVLPGFAAPVSDLWRDADTDADAAGPGPGPV